MLAAVASSAQQTSTQIDIGSTVRRAAVRPFGMNITEQNYWDAGQIHKNLIFRNPGFEPLLYNSVMRCVSGTATSCTDDTAWSVWPAGFWNGATYELVSGGQTIRRGTVSGYVSSSGGNTYTFADSGVAPAAGQILFLRKKFTGASSTSVTSGWWPSVSGGATVSAESADLSPASSGAQCARLNALASGASISLVSYFDSQAGRSYVEINGSHRISFRAKGVGGSNQIRVSAGRGALYVNQTVTLSSSWADYNIDFSGPETGSQSGTANVTFSVPSGSAVLLDDVSLMKTDGDAANRTAFRDPVVNALRQLRPGILRYWTEHLGETLDNQIAPVASRMRAGYRISYSDREDVNFGLHEFLELCEYTGADPWIVVPLVYTPAEAASLIEYLAGASSTVYGTKRAARGRTAPWTDVFSQIHLEFGNEAWNTVFRGGSIEYPDAYGARAQTIFAAMRSSSSYLPAKFDLVLGGQAVWIGRNQTIQANCNNNDSLAVAPYMMYEVNNYASNEEMFGSLFAEAEMNSRSGFTQQNRAMLNAAGRPVNLSVYEVNLHTTGGSISQQALDAFIPSLGTGLATTSHMLQMLRDLDVRNQLFYCLQQSFMGRSDGKRVRLWGAVIDMGVSERRRPQYLALQLANEAMSGDMMTTTHTGAIPTWNQPLLNGVQLDGANHLQSFAFKQGTTTSLILLNLHRSSALPVTFSGNAPSGAVTMKRLSAANITDNNESAENVRVSVQSLSSFNPSTPFSLPAYSMTVLTWTTSAATTPSLQIGSVATSGISQSGATIVWSTNLASDSQVEYGVTTALGQTTPLNASLVTGHSVALSGLNADTTYSYRVRSKDASGQTAVSAIGQFRTSAAAASLEVSRVAVANITTSGAAVLWATNLNSNSQVEFGTSSGLGQTTALDSAMVTSHSVNLSGLAPGTTYYYRARSTDGNGNTAVSLVGQFQTTAAQLTVSGAAASSITDTSAVITWSTSAAASTVVDYGTSGSLGARVTGASGVTSHSVTLSGLTASTAYYYRVSSQDAAGGSASSSILTFTTAASTSSGTPPRITWSGWWGITGSAITLSWATDVATTGFIDYGTSPTALQSLPVNTTPAQSVTYALSGLTGGTTYYYRIRVRNASGAEAVTSVVSFSTKDVAAPVISNIQVTQLSATTAQVSWTTNEASLGAVQYGPTTSYPFWVNSTAGRGSAHSATLQYLQTGLVYYQVWSQDAAGNVGLSASLTFTMR